MENFRSNPPQDIGGDEIVSIEDVLLDKVKDLTTGEHKTIGLPASNVLGFIFKSGNRLYLRPSGTEPKIKFYLLAEETTGTIEEKKIKAENRTKTIINYIKSECERA